MEREQGRKGCGREKGSEPGDFPERRGDAWRQGWRPVPAFSFFSGLFIEKSSFLGSILRLGIWRPYEKSPRFGGLFRVRERAPRMRG